MKRFVADLESCGGIIGEFNEPLWYATVDKVTVGEKTAAFVFKEGTAVGVGI